MSTIVTLEPTTVPDNPLIRMSHNDNVVVARVPIPEGSTIQFEGREINVGQKISPGHKIAV